MRTLIILMIIATYLVSCGKSDDSKQPVSEKPASKPPKVSQAENKPETSLFNLAPSPAQMNRSKFCSGKTENLPDDPTPAHRFEIDFLNKKLSQDGLRGWMHGVVPQFRHYTFTYRKEDPDDFMAFFKAEQFSVVFKNQELSKKINKLNRHDEVRLYGRVIPGASPLRHIMIDRLELIKPFDSPTKNSYRFDMSQFVPQTTYQMFGKVHAIVQKGKYGSAIVLEQGHSMVPIFVGTDWNKEVGDLFRNDIIKVKVSYMAAANRPPHFLLVADKGKPYQRIDSIVDCHGDETTLEGFLVKFKKSPAITTDVYAVRVVDENGIGRNFTFFPAGQDPDAFMDLFQGLKDKSERVWNNSDAKPEVVRNYWSKKSIRVRVTGKMNVVSIEQANPQIYIEKNEDLELVDSNL